MGSRRKPPTVSRWDRFLIGIAPGWGMRRVRAKASLGMLGRYYDAASGGRRTSGWRRGGADANATAASSLAALRELSRDLRRNNGWARRGIQTIGNNTVGWGILAKPSGVEAAAATKAIELWAQWAETPGCDHDGRLNFYGLQRVVMETVVESGEALVVRQPAEEGAGLPVPMRIQVLEGDYLDIGKSAEPRIQNGRIISNRIVQGVELDAKGRRVAYWLHRSHPGGQGSLPSGSQRVASDRVLHICRVERPGQYRGIPWLASAISRLQDLGDYEDARLMQQKIAACFSAFVQDVDGAGTAIGTPDTESPDEIESLEPGHIAYLPPGKSISFATPPGVADHASFTATNLRSVAASLGVTYEDLTGDYSQVNFSSARMARLAHWRNVEDWQWNMLIPQLCDPIWDWVMEMATAMQMLPAQPTATWAPQPMPMLDPQKEAAAYQQLLRIGALTWPQMISERGEDPAAQLEEIAATNKRFDDLGIVLDSDPRKVSVAGLLQQGDAAGGDGDVAGGSAR